jgi:hypothetical protein
MNTAYHFIIRSATAVAAVFGATLALSQDQPAVTTTVGQPETITVPLSRPGEPISMHIDIMSAHIEVIGEERKDVSLAVTLTGGRRKIVTPSGAKTLAGGGAGLEINERDNRVSIESDGPPNPVSIVARVPRRAKLDLSTVERGDIVVRDIVGDLQLENVNGPITAKNINGTVIAETVNAPIDVGLTAVAPGGATSLSTLNGAITLALPANVKTEQTADRAQRAPRRRLGAHGGCRRGEHQWRRAGDSHQDRQRRHQAEQRTGLRIQAATYRPRPNTVCVTRLLNRAAAGFGVRLAAIPAPMPGCISRNGATMLPMPTISAGPIVGRPAQSRPYRTSRAAANAMPIA